MLPIYPQQSEPERPEVPPAPLPSHLDLVAYWIAGAICGALGGCFAECGMLAYERFEYVARSTTVGIAPPLNLFDLFAGKLIVGAILGLVGGLLLWISAFCWPASKHPIRCASLCASLSGTAFMLLCLLRFGLNRINLEDLAGLACVLVACALYGFATAWLVRSAHGLIARFRA